jgi:L-lysine 6-transaminase
MTHRLDPQLVHPTLKQFMMADGYEFVLDLGKSKGSWLVDSVSGETFLDFFTCFASWPIGYNHELLHSREFRDEIVEAATHNPSNSDLYTTLMGEFVQEFGEHVMPKTHPHVFFISGGALGVENALKAAFDWKIRLNQSRNVTVREPDGTVRDEVGTQILHFREAFHGRSGYTLSLTNTSDPRKTALFPKFRWPRVLNPKVRFPAEGENLAATLRDEAESLRQIEAAMAKSGPDIAAIIIETIQCEGGDNHFRAEFLRKLREICDREDILLIFDEVQAGYYGSGRAWCYEYYGVEPDLVCFGKKAQVCGFFSNRRIEKVKKNVFEESSRINSTWGGNLADMTRSKWIRRAIERDGMARNAEAMGEYFVQRLRELGGKAASGWAANARGRGTLAAFDCPTKESRDRLLSQLQKNRMVALKCGDRSVRFRPPLNVTKSEIDVAMERIVKSLGDLDALAGVAVAGR